MRARYALYKSAIDVEIREIKLREKPELMLELSPKGTVPVLSADKIIDESLDIMLWALEQNDPDGWLGKGSQDKVQQIDQIKQFDREFKPRLDRYKYYTRHPERSQDEYFNDAVSWLAGFAQQLSGNSYLNGSNEQLLDAATAPFIRQFSMVDQARWQALPMPELKQWLERHLSSEHWQNIMVKYEPWQPGQDAIYL